MRFPCASRREAANAALRDLARSDCAGRGCRIRNEFTQNHGERRKEPLEPIIHPVLLVISGGEQSMLSSAFKIITYREKNLVSRCLSADTCKWWIVGGA